MAIFKITSVSGYKSTINYEEVVPDVWCGRVKNMAKKGKKLKIKRHIFSLFLYICNSVNDMSCFKTVKICHTKHISFQTKLKPLSLYMLLK